MDRRIVLAAGAAAVVTALVAVVTVPAAAGPAPAGPTPDGIRLDGTDAVPPEMVAALRRDLGLSPAEVTVRLAAEGAASRTELRLRKSLGNRFGGAWLGPDGTSFYVAVTDASLVPAVRAAGAEPKVVARSEAELDALKARLDAAASRSPKTVPGWYVDPASNSVVVLSRTTAFPAARAFAESVGAGPAVRIVASTETPRPLIDVIGGNAYFIGAGTRCSVGFSVNGGFVTAGHCGSTGASTSQPSGTFRGSSFPGNDYAWVQVAAGNTPRGLVNNYSGGTVAVAGSQDAAIGASVCRSGSTTGWHCGTIQARNASVTYPQGTVTGLIRTNVCAEPGDSGGSLLAGTQAQGVTSGGSGNCGSGGTTFFQPVNEILTTYGLTLVTSGGGGPTDPPPPTGCTGYESTATGTLASGGTQVQPNGSYFFAPAGAHAACLDGPTGRDFDLYLQRWTGAAWATVASSTSPAPDEQLTLSGSSGYYRYVVHAYSGSGTYSLGYNAP